MKTKRSSKKQGKPASDNRASLKVGALGGQSNLVSPTKRLRTAMKVFRKHG